MNNILENLKSRVDPYVIAEIGINHNGQISLAKEMIDAAHENYADCVKFQSFSVDKYISPLAVKAAYQQQRGFEEKSQREIIKACELEVEQSHELFNYSRKRGIDFLSTPFEVWSLRELVELDLPWIKISSCNLTNIPFLEEAAATSKPILLSTGMANFEEVISAVDIFKSANSPLMLFQCTSNYPSDPQNANLKVIQTYRKLFDVPVGLSDHTKTNITSIAAVALGAIAIEKHFTLSKSLPGIDQQASMEPNELRQLVLEIRECKKSLGSPLKFRTSEEQDTSNALRRSLVASKDIKQGESLSKENVLIMRPGTGLSPENFPLLQGKKFSKAIKKGTPLSMNDFLVS